MLYQWKASSDHSKNVASENGFNRIEDDSGLLFDNESDLLKMRIDETENIYYDLPMTQKTALNILGESDTGLKLEGLQ